MEATAPASVSQRLIWALDRHRRDGGALNWPLVCWLEGELDVERLRDALYALATRHQALRTTVRGGRQLLQVAHDARPASLEVVDVSGADDPLRVATIALAEELSERIDPTVWPTRCTLWKTAPTEHLLCINVHHIVTDQSSSQVIFDDLISLLRGDRELGADGEWTFFDFARWETEAIAGDAFAGHRRYWTNKLDGVQLVSLPLGPAGSAPARPMSVVAELDAGVGEQIDALARELRSTPFAVLLALFFGTCHCLTGQEDMAVASVFANRLRPETRRTVGCFVNLVVLRSSFGPNPTLRSIVAAAGPAALEAFVHQELPCHAVQAVTGLSGGQRVDDVVFQVVPESVARSEHAGGLTVRSVVPDVLGRFQAELSVMRRARGDGYPGFDVKLSFNAARLTPSDADELLRLYALLAHVAVRAPDSPLVGIAGRGSERGTSAAPVLLSEGR